MGFIEKKEIGDQKILSVAGINIPYKVEEMGEKRKAVICGIPVIYYRDTNNESVYFKIFNKKLYFKESRKARHYRLRDKLNDEVCKKMLVEEISPLVGYKMNLDNPETFNEKINWLKIHNHDPRITTCCDKYAVKQYATEKIGSEYVLPVLGVWENPEDIDFSCLPEKFALKVNWSSGFNIIVKDKAELNIDETREQLRKWMLPSSNSYYDTFNYGYKHMKPVIYAEPYIEQIDGQVYDYKLYFTNGEFIYMFIATDRLGEKSLTYTFFDNNFNHLPFTYGGKPNATPIPQMPKNLDKMLELGKVLASDFPFVRVDFYEVGEDEIYLGEMTFYSGGGTLPMTPVEWDKKLGEKIKI